MIKRNTLKFRAFDTETKIMLCEGFHIIGEVMMFGLIDEHIRENLCGKDTLERYNDIVITQFSGRTDSNGKDIYEGDIVNVKGLDFLCVWENCGMVFRCVSDMAYVITLNPGSENYTVVKGSIFDNFSK